MIRDTGNDKELLARHGERIVEPAPRFSQADGATLVTAAEPPLDAPIALKNPNPAAGE